MRVCKTANRREDEIMQDMIRGNVGRSTCLTYIKRGRERERERERKKERSISFPSCPFRSRLFGILTSQRRNFIRFSLFLSLSSSLDNLYLSLSAGEHGQVENSVHVGTGDLDGRVFSLHWAEITWGEEKRGTISETKWRFLITQCMLQIEDWN